MKRRAGLLLVVATLTTACGLRPSDLPIPGTYLAGEHYTIDIEFTSVLNLPERAKVMVDGVEVGVLDSVELVGDTAVARVDIRADVQLPVDTTAELRQNTILGDMHIALDTPDATGERYLFDGGRISQEHTRPATNIEDTLRALSNVITGGPWTALSEVVADVNAALPDDPAELDKIMAAGRAALHDMATHTDEIDRILDDAAAISTTLAADADDLDRILDVGPKRANGLADVIFGVVLLLQGAGEMAHQVGNLLLPVAGDLRSIVAVLAPATQTVATADLTVAEMSSVTEDLLRDRLIPFFSAPPDVRITLTTSAAAQADARAQAEEFIKVLRAIGMIR
ncbi:phospholipid/cholesterol/gamma-HCH transport system substrate-binding protein [Nocardia farcinica]|uniref:Virulence factor Mce family protein n=1 Tax=Nocardia farcinica TaxID=37329 RepID=A0A0H5NPR7_NOCFR|nr:MlaD family protein [Nocardia farcinica]AXK85849.1 MCE family protein [Nocardia farcinica]PFW98765.1 hypothetical protein CJ469_05934 [Nocardia farcinica]PFX04386.1 hypothetical protein CJ468_05550 [Nocardia farcinica]CRY77865.1 virulence factor Mce family protein [Nocardia farcinica]SIT34208.1 phospholipid/cholesterol/gamma-HCH transport system substrate-binding protein [Nocardia farcinica]